MAETPPSDNDLPDSFSPEQVDEIVASRAAIEQAKGVLMFVYDIDADTAFEMLRQQFRTASIKLRLLAQQLMNDVEALTRDQRTDMQSACSNLLLTVHERVRPAAEGT
jgi:hypothetical protein